MSRRRAILSAAVRTAIAVPNLSSGETMTHIVPIAFRLRNNYQKFLLTDRLLVITIARERVFRCCVFP